MKTSTFKNILAGSLAGTGAAVGITGIMAAILFKITLPRQKEMDDPGVEKLRDKRKVEEYSRIMKAAAEWLQESDKEDVYITARDGIKLHAFYIPAEKREQNIKAGSANNSEKNPPRKLAILHHGFTSKALYNSTFAKLFHDEGFDVLLLDLRAHGESEGKYNGFGILDRYDTEKWIKYAKHRFGDDVKIILHGVSMGGSTVIMALGLESVQKSVSAVIADCSFTSPDSIIEHIMKNKLLKLPTPKRCEMYFENSIM